MRIGDAFPSKYLKAKDLQGQEVPLVIDSVTVEDIGSGDKAVIRFRGKEKGLVCNKTNGLMIAAVYGEETDGWVGKDLILYPTTTMFEGSMVPCLRVRVPITPAQDTRIAPEDVGRVMREQLEKQQAEKKIDEQDKPKPGDADYVPF
jgi:hypothetical protein